MTQAAIPVPGPAASGAAGQPLPAVGCGPWNVERPATAGLVEQAIGLGYRHLDGASAYGNEAEAG